MLFIFSKPKEYFSIPRIASCLLLFSILFVFFLPTPVQAGVGTMILKGLAWLGSAWLSLVSKLLAIAALFFDKAVEYSILMVGKGGISKVVFDIWASVRDVVNLFFIFILLYISIGIILQLAGFDTKALLTKVIVIALLVNFSLAITGLVIDASNILALEFYGYLKNIKGYVKDSSGGVVEERNIGLAEAFVRGLDPQSLFDKDTKNLLNNPDDIPVDKSKIFWAIMTITFFGTIMILVAAFVIFVAGILFIVRTVALWLIMALSPLAFVAHILPRTEGYAKEWWQKLFHYSFFAPAFLFLYYIVVRIVAEGGIINDFTENKFELGSMGQAVTSPNSSNIVLIMNFLVLIALLIASLILAHKMGMYGSSTMIGWGKKLKAKAQGYAGRIAKKGVVYPLGVSAEVGKRAARRAAGWPASLLAVSKVSKAPLIGKPIAKKAADIAIANRKKIEELQEQYKEYSTRELKNILPTMPFGFKRAAVMSELLKRGDISGLPDKEIVRNIKLLERYGMFDRAREFKKLRPDLIEDEKERSEMVSKLNAEEVGKLSSDVISKIFTHSLTRKAAVENWSPEHYGRIKRETLGEILKNKEVLDEMLSAFGHSHVKKISDIGGEPSKEFFDHLAKMGNTFEEIANKLKSQFNNLALASMVLKNSMVRGELETRGVKQGQGGSQSQSGGGSQSSKKGPTIYDPYGRPYNP